MRFLLVLSMLFFSSLPAYGARVALVPFGGEADPALVRQAETLARDALGERRDAMATADEVTRSARRLGLALPLSTTDQHLRLGRALAVEYVLAGRVTPLAGQYNLALTVYQVSDGRTEVLEQVIVAGGSEDVVPRMLERLLRPGGLGEEPDPAQQQQLEQRQQEEQRRQEELRRQEEQREQEEQRQQEEQRRLQEQRRQEEERRRHPPTPPQPLLSYTPDSPLGLRAGLGLGFLLGEKPTNRGPAIAIFRAQGAYTLLYKFGLEARAGLDIAFGTTGYFSVLVGGGMTPPVIRGVPLYVGGGVDLGLFVNTSGARNAFFQLRPSARAVYVIGDRFEIGLEPAAFTFLLGSSSHAVFEMDAFFGVRLAP